MLIYNLSFYTRIETQNSSIYFKYFLRNAASAIVLEMQKDFPNAKILLLEIIPRYDAKDAARRLVCQ
jgi:hypothetical protein